MRMGNIKKLISSFVILAMTLTMIPNAFVTAATNTSAEQLASSYLNVTSKNLYLGNKDTASFDINIKKSAQKKGNKYTWYIKKDKGNPDAVSINADTGMVTAKKAGTSYVRCKVTFSDGTVVRPEAKITVINNISGVKINNLPKDMTMKAGQEYDFNRTILDTKGGKGIKSEGITRWEIKEDTAAVNQATELGMVFPVKSGQFRIRAVAFENEFKYNQWLDNKKANAKYITASTAWSTIKVEGNNTATAKTQEQLDKVLDKEFAEINLVTSKNETFVIKKGNYLDKSLIVNAPNSDVNNYALFKDITIKAIKDTTWIEYADGNIVFLSDTESRFVVDSSAHIKQIVFDTPNSKINFEVNGIVDQIKVVQPTEVTFTGSSTNIPLILEKEAEGSTIATSVPLHLTLRANADIALTKGAEDTKIDKSSGTIIVNVENNSAKPVTVTTNNANGAVVEAGKSQTGVSTPNAPNIGGDTYNPPVQPLNVSGVSVNNPTGTGDVTVTATASNYGSSTATVELIGTGAPASATNVTIGTDGLITKTFNNVANGTYTAKVTVGAVNASSSSFTVAVVPVVTNQTLTTLAVSTSEPKIGTMITVTPKDADGNTIASGVTYQWYWSISDIADTAGLAGSGGTDGQWATYGIGAQGSTYTPTYPGDGNKFILIVATKGGTTIKTKIANRVTANVSGYTHYSGAFNTSTPIAISFSGNDTSNLTYQWYYTNNATINDYGTIGADPSVNWVAISGATTNPYTPTSDDLTHRLMIKAMGADGSYTRYAVYTPVTDLTTLVVSTTEPKVGTAITVVPKDAGGNTIASGVTYQWYWAILDIADTAGLAGSGGTDGQWATYGGDGQSSTFTPIYPRDTGKFVLIVATRGSTVVKTKIANRVTANVEGYSHYSGDFNTSTPITINFSGNDVSNLTFQWYYTENETINAYSAIGVDKTTNWVAITGATTNPYTPTNDDLFYRLMIKAFGADGSYTCYAVYNPF